MVGGELGLLPGVLEKVGEGRQARHGFRNAARPWAGSMLTLTGGTQQLRQGANTSSVHPPARHWTAPIP